VWSKSFGDGAEQDGFELAVAPTGVAVLIGIFWGQVSFGGAPLLAGGVDSYLAVLAP
jgi:hypothetical protein